jgi:predicted RNA-binding protein associated with RNAse of E/G family
VNEIEIAYTRPPDRVTIFRQQLVHRAAACVVTLLEQADVVRPVTVRGKTVLEPGAPIVWFTFPGTWHDVGRFHTADGRFTGFYANILTPVDSIGSNRWSTTDLFLDVWLDEGGTELLDAAELAAALEAGWVTPANARRARAEADGLLRAAQAGTWPPAVCREWTLDRARGALAGPRGTRDGDTV